MRVTDRVIYLCTHEVWLDNVGEKSVGQYLSYRQISYVRDFILFFLIKNPTIAASLVYNKKHTIFFTILKMQEFYDVE